MTTTNVLAAPPAMGAAEVMPTDDSGAVAAMSRERFEIEGAMILARRFPRQEEHCREQVRKACERPGFAEGALYSFPRGSKTVDGPSVKLAREMSRIWGNMRSGFRVLGTDTHRQEVHVQGFAFDVQTNTYRTEESRARTRIYRKGAGYINLLSDDIGGDTERQLSELVGRVGAKLERNCLLRLLPSDMVDESVEGVKITQAHGVDPDALRNAVRFFGGKGVTLPQIEQRIGKPISEATKDDIATLKRIAESIVAGEGSTDEFFEAPEPTPEPEPAPEAPQVVEVPPSGASAESPGVEVSDGLGAPEPPLPTIFRQKRRPANRTMKAGDIWFDEKSDTWHVLDAEGTWKPKDSEDAALLASGDVLNPSEAPEEPAPEQPAEAPQDAPESTDALTFCRVGPDAAGVTFGDLAPDTASSGDYWINGPTGEVYLHDGSMFLPSDRARTALVSLLSTEVAEAARGRKLDRDAFQAHAEGVIGERPKGLLQCTPTQLWQLMESLR